MATPNKPRKTPANTFTFTFTFGLGSFCPGDTVLGASFTKTGCIECFQTGRLVGNLSNGQFLLESLYHDGDLHHIAWDLILRPQDLPGYLKATYVAFSPRLRAQLRARGIKVPR